MVRMQRRSSERIVAASAIAEIPDPDEAGLSHSWGHSEFSTSNRSFDFDINDLDLDSSDHNNFEGGNLEGNVLLQQQSLSEQLMNQRWHEIGNGAAPISASAEFDVMVDQLTAVLSTRLCDLLVYWMSKQQGSILRGPNNSNNNNHVDELDRGRERRGKNNKTNGSSTPLADATDYLRLDTDLGEYVLIDTISDALRGYVTAVGKLYNHVGFHSFEHATHVTLSMNKLLSMVPTNKRPRSKRNLMKRNSDCTGQRVHENGDSGGGVSFGGGVRFDDHQENLSYGIGEDPRILFAMVFSALIHDLGHTGVPNSVLVEEEDELAILHNDVSVAEQNSLQVAFSMLLKDEFAPLKKCICPTPEERKFFRTKVISMVMVTDISDQERIQIVKSRWNAAFPPDQPREDEDDGDGGASSGDSEDASAKEVTTARLKRLPPRRGLTKSGIHASQRGLMKKDIKSTELREHNYRRRFTMFTSNAAVEELAKERQARRLGIRTSMDFSGMLLDAYRTMDQLQQHAVLETMMNVADVAHTMQSFQVFVKWNKRLFKEFYVAHLSDRLAFNPSDNWYENQIGFFSHYIIPLSQKMKTCGVFGTTGSVFEYFAMENKKKWTEEGEELSEEIIRDVTEEVEKERQAIAEGRINGCTCHPPPS